MICCCPECSLWNREVLYHGNQCPLPGGRWQNLGRCLGWRLETAVRTENPTPSRCMGDGEKSGLTNSSREKPPRQAIKPFKRLFLFLKG